MSRIVEAKRAREDGLQTTQKTGRSCRGTLGQVGRVTSTREDSLIRIHLPDRSHERFLVRCRDLSLLEAFSRPCQNRF